MDGARSRRRRGRIHSRSGTVAGSAGLPLVSVDGVTVATGRYPARTELARWAGLDSPAAVPAGAISLGLSESEESSCCGDSGCC